MSESEKFIKGRGAQLSGSNRFNSRHYDTNFFDDNFEEEERPLTHFTISDAKTIVNQVKSPDVGMIWSSNPYQGCEHGCVYCYARTTHQYWGYNTGLDFEQQIIVKRNAPELLKQWLQNPKWIPEPISLSGNTDCYQPAERKFQLTRKMLEVFAEYKNPVGIVTKNTLFMRDLDIIEKLAKDNLIKFNISITSMDEDLRRKMEPRTSTFANKLKAIKMLSEMGLKVHVLVAPIIPGLNDHEIPTIIEQVANHGAHSASTIIVRLNGEIAILFEDWIRRNYTNKAEKVLNLTRETHGGNLADHRFGTRMKGEGVVAQSIQQLFKLSVSRHLPNYREKVVLNTSLFRRPSPGGQLDLFF